MSLSNNNKTAILKKLRSVYNQPLRFCPQSDDEFPTIPIDFKTLVCLEMDEILQKELYCHVEAWGVKCTQARKEAHLTLEQAAKMIGITKRAVLEQEKKGNFDRVKKQTIYKNKMPPPIETVCEIDPFYIEAFSFIYHCTPKQLLQIEQIYLPCVPYFSPDIEATANQFMYHAGIVVYSFAAIDKYKNIFYLNTVIHLAEMTQSEYHQFLDWSQENTSIKLALKRKIPTDFFKDIPFWYTDVNDIAPFPFSRTGNEPISDEDRYYSALVHARYTFQELALNFSSLLETITQLVLDLNALRFLTGCIFLNGNQFAKNTTIDEPIPSPQYRLI